MEIFELLAAAFVGYRVTGAISRWQATFGVLGGRRALAGAALMARLRSRAPMRGAHAREVNFWLVHPTVPLLFEAQVIVLVLAATWLASDLATVRQLVLGPTGVLVAAWALARASESVLPPCVLYLGVSEPGQFSTFTHLASARRWLSVSAIDQADPEISDGDVAADPAGSLLRGMVRHLLARVPVYGRLAMLPFQRRRLESVRTTDELWEPAIRALIAFVPMIVVDLRSRSTIVNHELVWVLQSGAAGRLVLVTLPDGSNVLAPLFQRTGIEAAAIARLVDDRGVLLAVDLLDGRAQATAGRPDIESALQRLAHEIAGERDRIEHLLRRLGTPDAPAQALDAEIDAWANGGAPAGAVPAYTRSLPAAVALLRRRIDKASYSLHLGDYGRSVWADLGVQPIAESFRVSVSALHHDTAAKALVDALLRAELGIASGRRQGSSRTLDRPPEPMIERALREGHALLARFPFLNGRIGGDWRHPAGERVLAEFFTLSTDGIGRDDEASATAELEQMIDALDGRGRYRPVHGPYSIRIDVGIDGSAGAEIALLLPNRRWGVVRCNVGLRPALALMLAAIKAEHEVFDGLQPLR